MKGITKFIKTKGAITRQEKGAEANEAIVINNAMNLFQSIGAFPDLKNLIEFQRTIINYCADGLMVVDKFGKIIYVNDSFCEVHEITLKNVIGKHVTEVIDNTELHITAQTGVADRVNPFFMESFFA